MVLCVYLYQQLAKNRKDRKRARDATLSDKDPATIKAQIAGLERQANTGALNGPGRQRLDQLKAMLPRVETARAERMAEEQAAAEEAARVTSSSSLLCLLLVVAFLGLTKHFFRHPLLLPSSSPSPES